MANTRDEKIRLILEAQNNMGNTIDLATEQLDGLEKEAKELDKQLESLEKNEDLINSFDKLNTELKQTEKAYLEQVEAATRLKQQQGDTNAELKKSRTEYAKAEKAVTAYEEKVGELAKKLDKVKLDESKKDIMAHNTAMERATKLYDSANAQLSEHKAELDRVAVAQTELKQAQVNANTAVTKQSSVLAKSKSEYTQLSNATRKAEKSLKDLNLATSDSKKATEQNNERIKQTKQLREELEASIEKETDAVYASAKAAIAKANADKEATAARKQATEDLQASITKINKANADQIKQSQKQIEQDEKQAQADKEKKIALEQLIIAQNKYEKELTSLYKAQADGNVTARQVIDRQKELRKELDLVGKSIGDAEKNASKLTAEYKNIKNATASAASSIEKSIADQIKQSQKKIEQDEKQAQSERDKKVALEQLIVAQNKYEQELTSLYKAQADGNITAKQVIDRQKELRKELDLVGQSVGDAEKNASKLAAEYKNIKAATANVANSIKKSTYEFEKLADQLDEAELETEAFRKEFKKLNEELDQTQDIKSYTLALKKLSDEMKDVGKAAKLAGNDVASGNEKMKSASKSTDLLTQTTRRLAQAYTVLLAAQKSYDAIYQSVAAYGELESALVGVQKTTDLTKSQMVELADEFERLSKDITPTATTELLRFATVAGQMGVKSTEDILKIAVAADALGVSTNIAGDEAVKLSARILQMTGEGIPAINNFASALVTIGNNAKANEDELINMTKEIAVGTTAMEIGSAQALAYGAALIEAGQAPERSRTAFQRLATTIVTAAETSGGKLEQLAKIAGETGDTFKKKIDEEPNEAILALLNGFNGLQKEGKVLANVLDDIGIGGEEPLAVFSALSKQTENLEKMMRLSNDAFEDQSAHFREAASVYATQDAAIGRLVNQYTSLQKAIGESFSDETDAAIRTIQAAIESNEQAIINLFDTTKDLTVSFFTLAGSIGEAASSLGDFSASANDLSFVERTTGGLEVAFNSLSLMLKKGTSSIKNFGIVGTNALDALFDGRFESIQKINENLSKSYDKLSEDITNLSIKNSEAAAYLRGDTTKAYQQFSTVLSENKEAFTELDEQMRLEIINMANSASATEENEAQHRKLTAILIESARKIESVRNQKAELVNQTIKSTQAEIEAIKTQEQVTFKMGEQQVAQQALIDSEKIAKGLLDSKIISQDEYLKSVNEAIIVRNKELKAIDKRIEKTVKELNLDKEFAAQHKNLIQSLKEGVVSREDVLALQEIYLKNMEKELVGIDELTTGQAELQKQIADTAASLSVYEEKQRLSIAAGVKEIQNTNNLAAAKKKLSLLQTQLADLQRTENANIFEAAELNRIYTQQLEDLTVAYESGTISVGEYNEQSADLNAKIALTADAAERAAIPVIELSDATKELGESAQLTAQQMLDLHSQTGRMSEVAKATGTDIVDAAVKMRRLNDESTSTGKATNLLGESQAYLNQQFSFSSKSAAELSARYDELEGKIRINANAQSLWWREISNTYIEGFKREQQIISQTKRYREWRDELDEGSISMRRLSDMARSADKYFRDLSSNQLSGLKEAIADAQRQFDGLSESIDNQLDSLQDRLDRLKGDEESIAERAAKNELEQLQKSLEEAQLLGNRDAERRARDAVSKLKEIHRLEEKERVKNRELQRKYDLEQREFNTVPDNRQSQDNRYTVEIKQPSGATTDIQVASQGDANTLLDLLQNLGEVNIGG